MKINMLLIILLVNLLIGTNNTNNIFDTMIAMCGDEGDNWDGYWPIDLCNSTLIANTRAKWFVLFDSKLSTGNLRMRE